MSKQIREGEKDKARGKAREEVGKMTNGKSERVKGKLEQVNEWNRSRKKLSKDTEKIRR
jgi:uncharacterized protein YjbJ (UPF0337 family)